MRTENFRQFVLSGVSRTNFRRSWLVGITPAMVAALYGLSCIYEKPFAGAIAPAWRTRGYSTLKARGIP